MRWTSFLLAWPVAVLLFACADIHFLLHLRDLGRESAGRWLETSFDRLGVVSSLECDGILGRGAALLSRVTTQAGSRAAPYAGQTQTSAEPSHPTGAAA
jgi:hypothetical protein